MKKWLAEAKFSSNEEGYFADLEKSHLLEGLKKLEKETMMRNKEKIYKKSI